MRCHEHLFYVFAICNGIDEYFSRLFFLFLSEMVAAARSRAYVSCHSYTMMKIIGIYLYIYAWLTNDSKGRVAIMKTNNVFLDEETIDRSDTDTFFFFRHLLYSHSHSLFFVSLSFIL